MSLFLTAPDLAQAKNEENFFVFNMNDPINRLKFKPSKREGTKPGRTVPGADLTAPQTARPALTPAVNAPALPTPTPEILDTKPEEKVEEKKEEKVEEKIEEKPEEKKDDSEKKEDDKIDIQ
jgi:hypothetical protein